MNNSPEVSIIIPVKPGGAVRSLRGLQKMEDSSISFEVLVTEGFQPSRQRNRAAAASSGQILFFLDDDSIVTPGFLSGAARHFERPDVAVVGGPSLTPDSDSTLQHAFAMVFSSLFGGGGMRNRYRRTGKARETRDNELILCNLAIRREAFFAHGGFDERLYPNEENELLERIEKGGGLLVHDPGLYVFRSQRPALKAFCRQLYSYGRGRGEQTVISGVVRPITLVPSMFIIYLILMPLLHNIVYYVPLLCYLIVAIMSALFEGARLRRPLPALFMPCVFPVFHLCYGTGVIVGLFSAKKKQVKEEGAVTVRRVKEPGKEWTC